MAAHNQIRIFAHKITKIGWKVHMRIRHISSFFVILISLCTLLACNKDNDDIAEMNDGPLESFITYTEENHQSSNSNEDQNLLQNGGLEEWYMFPYQYDIPTGWFCHNNTNVRKEHKNVFEGTFSAKMQAEEKGKSAIVDQIIAVCPGHQIQIRFHYFVEQWKSKGARTYCYFRTDAAEKYNISADDLQAFYGKATYYIIRGGGYNLTYFPHELNIWQTFDETIEVPPTANYFVFGINSYYGTTIYVDDCYVIDVTEQIPTGIRDVKM